MPKKHIVSRSRGHRLQVERLEERSMLAADVEAGFDDASFDWSQFDDAAWFDQWMSDVTDFGDQPPDADLSWLFEDGFEEPWPAEPDALPEEPVGDDAAAATGDGWETTDAETPDVAILEEPTLEEPLAEEPLAEEPLAEEPVIEEPVIEEPVIEDTSIEVPALEDPIVEDPVLDDVAIEDTSVEVPVPEEAVTGEPVIEEPVIEEPVIEEPVFEEPVLDDREPADWEYLLLSDGFSAETTDDDFGWDGGADWFDPLPLEGDEGQALLDEELLTEETETDADAVASGADFPTQQTVTSVGSEAPRQAGFSVRAAAFSAMRMFAGFSFSAPTDSGDDGPVFAGGRRRSRR